MPPTVSSGRDASGFAYPNQAPNYQGLRAGSDRPYCNYPAFGAIDAKGVAALYL